MATASRVRVIRRSDGCFTVRLGTRRCFTLPPLHGCLFHLLTCQRRGHDVGDGLGAYKSSFFLADQLVAFAAAHRDDARVRSWNGSLNQTMSQLRGRLHRAKGSGCALRVERRSGLGYRVVVRRAVASV